MSFLYCPKVPVQNTCVPQLNASRSSVAVLSRVPDSAIMLSEKDTDTASGSRAHKILQYGSRHTIQNTGWTTRLSCDPPSRRNSHLPIAAKSQKPVFAQLPFISISKPTVLTLQSSTPVVPSVPPCPVSSVSVLQTMLTQPLMSTSALPSSNTSALNHAVLTMPTVNNNTAGKPTTVCFIPVSSVLCGPVSGLPTDVRAVQNVQSTFAVPQDPHLVGVNKTLMPSGQTPGLQLLTLKVHIDNGHITEVTEVQPKQNETHNTRGMLVMDMNVGDLTPAVVSGSVARGQNYIEHVDGNGAQFGYHSFIDGTRVRIAKDTSGQRHAPFFLLPQCDDLCKFEECTLEIATSTNTESQVVPQEADVSEVGTVFTYEPFYVSEQTLTPVPRKEKRSHDLAVSVPEDESPYYYRCYLCAFISDDHEKVCRHWVNVHLTELPYRCPFCDRTFFTSTKAQVHVQQQHKESRSSAVAFQQSSYFANPLSYELGETDSNEDSDSDDDDEVRQQIVLGHSGQQAPKIIAFACHTCRFQSRSSLVMRQHVKFVHGNGRYYRLLPHHVARQKVAQVTNTQSNGTSNVLRAEIAWSNISEKVTDGSEYHFRCRWCSFQAKNVSEMSSHVLREHQWPAAVLCPSCSCNVQLTDSDRKSTSVVCFSCEATILLAPSTDSFVSTDRQDMIYMCNICAFKSRGKNSMCLHIKYNHTKCRPYACVYCNYVAVECSQVKKHISNCHPDHSVIVKERTEANEQFHHILHNLFPKLVSVQTSERVGLRLNEDVDDSESNSGEAVPSNDVDSPYFTCDSCNLETSSLDQLIRHQHQFHKSTLAANAAMIPAMHDKQSLETPVPGEHFKCIVCGYCCLDRSCMSRHVKYMHITARPHSCIYCSYNNVEKTKVRLHVMAHHPGLQKTVRTDHKILEEMSVQAKHFYVRIDDKGQVVNEGSGIMSQNGNSLLDRPTAASPSSSDSELPDDVLTDEQSQQHDVCTNNDESGLVNKGEGTCDVDDDVDLAFYARRNSVDNASSNSVVTLDHNYFRIPTADDRTADVNSLNDNVVIKQEPLDFDYEDGVSGMPYGEFSSSYVQHMNHGNPEVKTEAANDSSAFDSSEMSDSENDDFYYSGQSDESDTFENEYASENESFADVDEPARKKIRVSFGVDSVVGDSTSAIVDSIVIDSDVWQDPKMHMTPVVELEDVLQIILAWQQNAGETDDIM